MTQHNSINQEYALIRTLPLARTERENFQATITSYLKGVNVLDLPCGIDYYSNLVLIWGVGNHTSVNVSSVVVEGAKVNLKHWVDDGKAGFQVGDGIDGEGKGEGLDAATLCGFSIMRALQRK
jgi:hypothetical protein